MVLTKWCSVTNAWFSRVYRSKPSTINSTHHWVNTYTCLLAKLKLQPKKKSLGNHHSLTCFEWTWSPFSSMSTRDCCWLLLRQTLQGPNLSQLGKRTIIFKHALGGDMLEGNIIHKFGATLVWNLFSLQVQWVRFHNSYDFLLHRKSLSALEYLAMVHPIMDHAQTVWDTGNTSTFDMFQSFIDPMQAKCIQYIPFSKLTWQWTTRASKLFNPQIQNWWNVHCNQS